MEQLNLLHLTSLDCTHTLEPTVRYQSLLEYATIPWLWDLDYQVLRNKEASKPQGRDWDWELLIRQLAQPDIYEPGKALPNLPLGVRNRQRIWRLVEDLLAEAQ